MAQFRDESTGEMPDVLLHFCARDWIEGTVTDTEFDLDERRRYYDRPRTADDEIIAAYWRFHVARDAWERANPRWVKREVEAMVRRRLERQGRYYTEEDA